jgi:hypothetical protein
MLNDLKDYASILVGWLFSAGGVASTKFQILSELGVVVLLGIAVFFFIFPIFSLPSKWINGADNGVE